MLNYRGFRDIVMSSESAHRSQAINALSRFHIAPADAPSDNKGKGEAFSPTDLVATALATCISTTMGIKAEDLGVDLRGMTVSVQKEMSKDGPRRIVALPSEVHIPLRPDHPHREVLEQTALNCPVHKSLPPEIRRPTKFFWEG